MRKLSVTSALATIAILLSPLAAFAQGTGSSSSPSSSSPSTNSNSTSPPRGTNSAGTAQSSGGGLNSGAGVTSGAAGSESTDKAIADENKLMDRKVKGICRGC
jgi:hypothetical protein